MYWCPVVAVDPIRVPILARDKHEENWRFRQFLKGRCNIGSDELDRRVREMTDRIWSGIDCTTCANCCKTVHPTLSDAEVERLARRLGLERQQFVDRYLEPNEPDDDNPWRTRSTPCPFLDDNRCTVYEDRPADCRRYPYLHEPDFTSRTIAMIERTVNCPIVYEVIEELKRSTGFARRRRGT